MILTCVAAFLALVKQSKSYDEAFFKRLDHWRGQFNSVFVEPRANIGYTSVYSETLGPCHADAWYPIGSAADRFIVSFDGSLSTVQFQNRHGNKTSVDWYVKIVPTSHKRKVKGTIPNYLMRQGYTISPRTRLTDAMRKRLEAPTTFAGFGYHSVMGVFGYIVRPDGSIEESKTMDGLDSVLQAERELLPGSKDQNEGALLMRPPEF